MKSQLVSNLTESDSPEARTGLRQAAAALVGAVLAFYVLGIILGKIPEARRLSLPDLGVILVGAVVVGCLLWPGFVDRLTHVKVGNVELELRRLQHDQKMQQHELDDVRFVLTLLLQKNELQHLRNLEKGNTQEYVGSHVLRTELRKLRTLGLIQNCKDKHIGSLGDKTKTDLAKVVELTDRGRQYLERLGDYSGE